VFRRHREGDTVRELADNRLVDVRVGVPVDERGVVVDEVEPFLTVGVDDHRAAAARRVGRVRCTVDGRAGVASREYPAGSLEQIRRSRSRLPVDVSASLAAAAHGDLPCD